TLRQAAGRGPDELIGEFLTQYYDKASLVPKEILVPAEPPYRELLEEWLHTKRGSKVSLHQPQRGDKKRLVEMAIENAEHAARQAIEAAQAESERGRIRMESLKEALDLPELPRRIECYDISTLHGQESVGSMVVFEDGLPASSQYRLFRIRRDEGKADDYAMMREVLARRVIRGDKDEEFAQPPDLLVIDGGKGQLGVVVSVLEELECDYPVVSLAKRHEEVYVPGRSTPVILEDRSPGLHLLMHIRDEAHRFAITFHRKRRGKAATRSILDEIPGVGPKRKKALLERFPSVRELCAATVDDLAAVEGVSSNLAAEIHRRLKTPGTGAARREDRAPVPAGEWIDEGDETSSSGES
ncbi:MAG: excinuclease ABC subunit UvrC, partial [Armatimonadia bacterium]|nr:excinuclease ABC subunit UvrC [Armatimonadia bacterium]